MQIRKRGRTSFSTEEDIDVCLITTFYAVVRHCTGVHFVVQTSRALLYSGLTLEEIKELAGEKSA